MSVMTPDEQIKKDIRMLNIQVKDLNEVIDSLMDQNKTLREDVSTLRKLVMQGDNP